MHDDSEECIEAPPSGAARRPPVDFSVAHLTIDEVLAADRYAWCCPGPADVTFAYDGINVWRFPRVCRRELIGPGAAPEHGWRHRAGCTCEFCQGGDTARVPDALQ